MKSIEAVGLPPTNQYVYAVGVNNYGDGAHMIARYITAKTMAASGFFDESVCWEHVCDYEEETDTYWVKEGWFEKAALHDEFECWALPETVKITHWCPLLKIEK